MGREGAAPPLVGHDELPTCRWAGAGQGGLAAPLAIPGIPGWLTLRVPSSLAAGLRSVIDAVSPSWLHIRSGYPCPRAKTGSGLSIPLHFRFGPDAAITGSTSCLATAPSLPPRSARRGQQPNPEAKPKPTVEPNDEVDWAARNGLPIGGGRRGDALRRLGLKVEAARIIE